MEYILFLPCGKIKPNKVNFSSFSCKSDTKHIQLTTAHQDKHMLTCNECLQI